MASKCYYCTKKCTGCCRAENKGWINQRTKKPVMCDACNKNKAVRRVLLKDGGIKYYTDSGEIEFLLCIECVKAIEKILYKSM